jgi:LysR family transcriptional regulator, carnitine catabolism transcriptional activator
MAVIGSVYKRMTNLNLRHLEALVAVAAAGNFTRAARVLHISQPALTVQIRQLEETIGVKLLDRNTRSVRLTRIGQQLTPVIQRVLREIDSVLLSAHDLATGDRGMVSVAALPSVCATILPRVVAEFRKQSPGVTVSLRDGVAARVLGMVKSDEVDFGVGSFADSDPALETVPLFTDRMRVVFPRSSPLRRRRTVGLKDVAGLPLILMDTQSSVRMLLDRAFHAQGLFPAPAYEVTFMATAVGMVKAGLGVAVLPSTAFEMSELGGLETRVIAHAGLTRTIAAAWRSGRSPSPAAASFLKSLIAGCKGRGARGQPQVHRGETEDAEKARRKRV